MVRQVSKSSSRQNQGAPDLADVVAGIQTTNRLLAMLAVKGLDQPRAIALLASLGFPPRDIASSLGVTANAVSIALHRQRKATKDESSQAPADAQPQTEIDGIA
jgi:DNA-directed RNA polymerase specialized sigma24 family protein